jgi:hypothetical protein
LFYVHIYNFNKLVLIIESNMALIYFYDASEIDVSQITEGLSGTDHHWEFVKDSINAENLDPETEVISVFVTSVVTREIITRLPKLKLIACRSTGFNNIDLAAATEHGITVVNVPTYGERSDEEQTEEECGKWSEDISEVFLVPMVEIGRGFGGEKVEERENRKEVAETDIEIAGDADEGIKENEEYREILSGAVLERGHEGREEIGSGPAFDRADDAEECIRGCDQDKEEKGECFFQAEDDGEVVW